MGRLKSFAGETVIYGFANVFSRVFAMFLIPLYTNFLGKIDYSNLIMLQSLFTVLTFMLALNSGVFYYYYEYENEKYRKIVFTSWFYYQVTVGIFLFIGLWFSTDYLKNLFIIQPENGEVIPTVLLLIGLQFFPYIINITNINLFRVDRKPKKVMWITFLESLFVLLFIGGGLLFFDFGIIGIFAAQIVARSLVALIYTRKALFFMNIKNFSLKLLKKLISFTWPFFIISTFSWVILSIDKFIGVESLSDKEDVAILALAMQLTIPIVILADMIRMAIGPFVMSIRKEKDADESYQNIFDISVFASSGLLLVLVILTPLAVLILANPTFMKVLNVVPLIAFASVLSLMYNQLAIAFSLSKKNIYIMYATVVGGILGFAINKLYMTEYGYVVSGISQIIAYGAMVVILYITGKKLTETEIRLTPSLQLLSVVIVFFVALYSYMSEILGGNYLPLIIIGTSALTVLIGFFLHQQKLSVVQVFKRLMN